MTDYDSLTVRRKLVSLESPQELLHNTVSIGGNADQCCVLTGCTPWEDRADAGLIHQPLAQRS